MSEFKQAHRICPGCNKSWWRVDGVCNVCGLYDPAPASFYNDDKTFSRENHPGKGRTWDSKKHKYVSNKG